MMKSYGFLTVLFAGCIILVCCLLAWQFSFQYSPELSPNRPKGQPIQLNQMTFSLGRGNISDQGFSTFRTQQGRASIQSPWMQITAVDFSMLSVDGGIITPDDSKLLLFWRRAKNKQQVHYILLPQQGRYIIPLSNHPEWQGEIIQLGFEVRSNHPVRYTFKDLTLLPATFLVALESIVLSATLADLRQATSINLLPGGDIEKIVSLAGLLLASSLLFLLSLLASVWKTRLHGTPQSSLLKQGALVCLLSSWLLLEIQWLNSAWGWVFQSDSLLELQQEQQTGRLNQQLSRFLDEIKNNLLPDASQRILYASTSSSKSSNDFVWLRSRYRLAPHNLYRLSDHPTMKELRSGDYLLIIGFYEPIQYLPETATLHLADGQVIHVTPIIGNTAGKLLKINR